MGYKKGQKVKLKGATSYESSTTSTAGKKRTGTFYIWSAATKNGRIRVTTKKSYAGRNPASKYVTCWVKTSSIKSSSGSKSSKGSSSKSSSGGKSSGGKKTASTKKKTSATSPGSKKNTTTVINVVESSDVTPTTTVTGQIGYLGMVLFVVDSSTIKTLDNFSLSESARYVEHDRHLKTPRLEFTGIDASKITFDIELSCLLGAGSKKNGVWPDYNTLRGYMNKGVAVPLKIGNKSYGNYRWCIQSLSFKGETTDATGKWIRAKVSVSLISVEKKG